MLTLVVLFSLSQWSPAPLVYTPGEGWSYESPSEEGGAEWKRTRAKDQLDVAREAFAAEDWKLAVRAARRVVSAWPISDYAAEALYLRGQAEMARGRYERAFKVYQYLIDDHPKSELYEQALLGQYTVARAFLNGRKVRLWGAVPILPSMNKTVEFFEAIIKNGPFSSVASDCQLSIGEAYEKKKQFDMAADAYATALDRYYDRREVEAEARFRLGNALANQAMSAEFDQTVTQRAIKAFNDFTALFPNDPRAPEAQAQVEALRVERARGAFITAQFYDKRGMTEGALVYYNEAVALAPTAAFVEEAQGRIRELQAQGNAE